MKRLYSLDALRGLAALAVVIWHWQHFYALSGVWLDGWQREAQPFFGLLKPLYLEGWGAVDLFFALSGYVFFWLYAQSVRERKVTAWSFALKRFSRLYPLHLLALLAVVALQFLFRRATGNDFIFNAHDGGIFVNNLLLLQQWAPPTVLQTFNGPAWTVSVEAGMYVLFFLLCRCRLGGPRAALTLSLAGILLVEWNELIARGLMGFFLGGAVYFGVRRLSAHPHARRIACGLAIVSLLLWGGAVVEIVFSPLHTVLRSAVRYLPPDVEQFYVEHVINIFLVLYIYTLIPTTVAALALRETVRDAAPCRPIKLFARLGDISYSTYMLHFPLQIACALTALQFGFGPSLFENGWTMVAFYGVLIGLGALSWRYYERPVQQFLRTLMQTPTARP